MLSPLLPPIALFYLFCACVAVVGNMTMFVVFIREKKFHNPCHYLITLTCLADMLHLCGHFVFNYQLFYSGPRSQEFCFWIQLPATIGVCIGTPLLLSMGIDRFIACHFPVFYRYLCTRPYTYLLLQLFFPVNYAIYLNISSFFERDPTAPLLCQVPLAIGSATFEIFISASFVMNLMIFVIYFITYLKLRKMAGNATQLKVIFKSIMYTVVFVILGWSTVTITNIIGIRLIKDVGVLQLLILYSGLGLNIASASNVFVFYMINTEYREAIRRLYGKSPVSPSTTKLIVATVKTR